MQRSGNSKQKRLPAPGVLWRGDVPAQQADQATAQRQAEAGAAVGLGHLRVTPARIRGTTAPAPRVRCPIGVLHRHPKAGRA